MLKHKYLTVIVLGLALGGGISWQFKSLLSPKRSISSINENLMAKPWAHSVSGKHRRTADVQIYNITDVETQSTTLQAIIKPLQNSGSSIQYKWIMPDGVSISEGEDSGSFPGGNTDEIVLEITVAGASETLEQPVVLQVFSDTANGRIGVAGAWSATEDPEAFSTGRGISE